MPIDRATDPLVALVLIGRLFFTRYQALVPLINFWSPPRRIAYFLHSIVQTVGCRNLVGGLRE